MCIKGQNEKKNKKYSCKEQSMALKLIGYLAEDAADTVLSVQYNNKCWDY